VGWSGVAFIDFEAIAAGSSDHRNSLRKALIVAWGKIGGARMLSPCWGKLFREKLFTGYALRTNGIPGKLGLTAGPPLSRKRNGVAVRFSRQTRLTHLLKTRRCSLRFFALIVYRLGQEILNLQSGVRFPVGAPNCIQPPARRLANRGEPHDTRRGIAIPMSRLTTLTIPRFLVHAIRL
jgi:hypothetical protein